LLGIPEYVERTFEPSPQTYLSIQAGHGLGIVIQNVGMSVHYDIDRGLGALKVRDQNFDFAGRNPAADCFNGKCEEFGAPVFSVVAVNACDDGVA
jgi:hypothetical protein